MEFSNPHPRPPSRVRRLALVLAAIAVANMLALLMTGPPRSLADEATAGPLIHHAPPAPDAVARSQAVERLGRVFVFISFNTVAVSGLAFAVIARRMEVLRRDRLGLPDGLDESAITPRNTAVGVRPRAANEYRPSLN